MREPTQRKMPTLKMKLLKSAEYRGHKPVGNWVALLAEFRTRKTLCTAADVYAFLVPLTTRRKMHTISQQNIRKRLSDWFAYVPISDGVRYHNGYNAKDIREFGRKVKAGYRFLREK